MLLKASNASGLEGDMATAMCEEQLTADQAKNLRLLVSGKH
jgi:hypothetical protein